MLSYRKSFMFCACIVGLAGCADTTQKAVPNLSFDHTRPVSLHVGEYTVEPAPAYAYGLPAGFVTDPAKKIEEFFRTRFNTDGAQGRFVVSITNVEVRENTQASENVVGQFLNVDKRDRYTIEATLRVMAYGIDGFRLQTVDVKAQQMVEMSEHVSLGERERLQMEAVHDLISGLDKQVQKIVSEQFRIAGGF